MIPTIRRLCLLATVLCLLACAAVAQTSGTPTKGLYLYGDYGTNILITGTAPTRVTNEWNFVAGVKLNGTNLLSLLVSGITNYPALVATNLTAEVIRGSGELTITNTDLIRIRSSDFTYIGSDADNQISVDAGGSIQIVSGSISLSDGIVTELLISGGSVIVGSGFTNTIASIASGIDSTNTFRTVRATNGASVNGTVNGTATAGATNIVLVSLPSGAVTGGLYVWNGTNMVPLSTSGIDANAGQRALTNLSRLVVGTGSAVITNSGNTLVFPNGISVGANGLVLNATGNALTYFGTQIYNAGNFAFTDSSGVSMLSQTRALLNTGGTPVATFSNRADFARSVLVAWTNVPPSSSSSTSWGPGFWATNTVAGTNYFAVAVASNSWIFTPYFVLP